jgi:HTH-type transcriptional regulator / antitoxin HigA
MTLTFDPDRYGALLSQYQPKLIKTEAENEQALRVIEELMHRSDLSSEETALYELLVILIEKFEQTYYSPGAASTPLSMLMFLMEQRDLQPQALVEVLGTEATVERIMQGEQDLSVTQAKALGRFFQVDASVFV